MEWEGGRGMFVPQRAGIVISSQDMDDIEPIAKQLQKEYKEVTGIELSVREGNKWFLNDGDIYLGISSQPKLQTDESYLCKIKDRIIIESKDSKGIFWGTRTLLQMLVQNPQEIVQGIIYDFPEYEVRGIGIDVARHPMSVDSLKILIQIMAYYKMNDLHLHLNDNELLGYSKYLESAEQSLAENYSAFRLESEIVNNKGEKITSEDYYYSTEEFQELISYASSWGISIVPEIDTPAHSLAITKRFPELCNYNTPGNVDILNIRDERTVELVHDIWNNALAREFSECDVVHVGMDEAYFGSNDYANYANSVINLGHRNNKKVRIWGSMTRLGVMENLVHENVQVNIWRASWANPQQVYEAGFDLINTVSENLYIIPAGGYDYLDNEYIYSVFEPNKFEVEETIYEVPKDAEQMLGASMFVWNDFCGTIDMGMTSLYVNGELLEQIGTNNPFELHGTFVFPITANETVIDMDSFSYKIR